MTGPAYDALLVVGFGGPEGSDDVIPFLRNVTAGRDVPPERLEEVAEQYLGSGGVSPLPAHDRAFVAAVGDALAEAGIGLPVYLGNRNWHPMLADTLRRMADDGIERALAFVTSAYSSYSGCRQYREDIERARLAVGEGAPQVDKIRPFFDHPGFVEPMVERVAEALRRLPGSRLVFTAHSLPLAMASASDYEAQLRAVGGLLADAVGHDEWDLVWQSRSGPPRVPWLEPDIGDHLRSLAADGVGEVTVVPIGFVADHQEVRYDLDTQAAAVAAEVGITMERAGTVGLHPRYVRMVVELVAERLDGHPPAERPSCSPLGPRPDVCPVGCCPAPRRP